MVLRVCGSRALGIVVYCVLRGVHEGWSCWRICGDWGYLVCLEALVLEGLRDSIIYFVCRWECCALIFFFFFSFESEYGLIEKNETDE